MNCPACNNLFDGHSHLPHFAKCGHSLCAECLQILNKGCGMCPTCKVIPLSGPLDAFPVNFSLLTLVQQKFEKVKPSQSNSTDYENIMGAINDISDITPEPWSQALHQTSETFLSRLQSQGSSQYLKTKRNFTKIGKLVNKKGNFIYKEIKTKLAKLEHLLKAP